MNEVLQRVSLNCLRGEAVPADLSRLWEVQFAGNDIVPVGAEITLVDVLDPDFFEGYRAEDGVPQSSVRSYQRMFKHILFFAKRGDGELLGYWLGEQHRALRAAPIVELDNEGQFHLIGRTLAEALIMLANDDEVDITVGWIEENELGVAARTRAEIWDKLEGIEDPNDVSWRYQEEEDRRS